MSISRACCLDRTARWCSPISARASSRSSSKAGAVANGKIPPRQGNRHPTIAPYESFATSDGEIVIAVGNDQTWKKFCPAIGLPELAADPRFTTNKDRIENYEAMRRPIERAFKAATSAEWIDRSIERHRRRQRRGA